jgi:hypothetical protein
MSINAALTKLQDPEEKRAETSLPPVILEFNRTNIPQDVLPIGKNGEHLILPTSARLTVTTGALNIEMIGTDPEQYYGFDYRQPTFADENPPIICMEIKKVHILRVIIGGYVGLNPSMQFLIKEPFGVMDGFTLTFSSTDLHNPYYWIKVLAKVLAERLSIAVETIDGQPDDSDIPF